MRPDRVGVGRGGETDGGDRDNVHNRLPAGRGGVAVGKRIHTNRFAAAAAAAARC